MSSIETKIHSFAKNPSSVKHNKRIIRTVTCDDIVMLNKTIEPKIQQNKKEYVLPKCDLLKT